MKNSGLSINDFDDEGRLKPGLVLPFLVIYYGRYFFLGPLSLFAGRGNSYDLAFLTNHHPLLMLTSVLPMFLGLLMLTKNPKRTKQGSALWVKGRGILLSTALIQLTFNSFLSVPGEGITLVFLSAQFFNLYLIYFLYRSERLKAFFR